MVVVDEASQSDIWALPALLRGKQLLVVGDHLQVSPSAVGIAEEQIKTLRRRFLANQAFAAQLTSDSSIYDLAKVIFAGSSVMLVEHFRSVPPIIEYSNREFYRNQIQPLRVPHAHERLDPPLVDVFVRGGHLRGDVNEAEALAIFLELEVILADEQFNGRSLGVVTLLGHEQAARINALITERISPMDVVERGIAVGPPAAFQGRERDIMMVSMVIAPVDRAAAKRLDMEQRFNVALPRARDRMYLFRSVTESQMGMDTLNGRLMQHFKRPLRQVEDPSILKDRGEKCESPFEREVFDELVARGYQVTPQVRCAGYRIDLVVEGAEGRRLAGECDGDRYHGPDRWHDDMRRQRVLERAGWTFWRCFASSFVRRRMEVMEDLVKILTGLSIQPLGLEGDQAAYVGYKEADPLGVAEPSEAEDGGGAEEGTGVRGEEGFVDDSEAAGAAASGGPEVLVPQVAR